MRLYLCSVDANRCVISKYVCSNKNWSKCCFKVFDSEKARAVNVSMFNIIFAPTLWIAWLFFCGKLVFIFIHFGFAKRLRSVRLKAWKWNFYLTWMLFRLHSSFGPCRKRYSKIFFLATANRTRQKEHNPLFSIRWIGSCFFLSRLLVSRGKCEQLHDSSCVCIQHSRAEWQTPRNV